MALDWDNLDYYNAYIRKMPKDNIVIDKQSGEIYEEGIRDELISG